eukprot:540551_1
MGRNTYGFDKYFDKTKVTKSESGRTTYKPCRFCGIPRATNSRDQGDHLEICKQISSAFKDEISTKLAKRRAHQAEKSDKKKRKKKRKSFALKSPCRSTRTTSNVFTPITPSKSAATQLSNMRFDYNMNIDYIKNKGPSSDDDDDIDIDVNTNSKFTPSPSPSQPPPHKFNETVPPSPSQPPPPKRRRLSIKPVQNMNNYFGPKMNVATFNVAATMAVRWFLSQESMREENVKNDLFAAFVRFINNEFGVKWNSLNMNLSIDIFQENVCNKLNGCISSSFGFIGIYHYAPPDDDSMGIFFVKGETYFFLQLIDVITFIDRDELKTDTVDELHPFTRIVNHLKRLNVKIGGVKANMRFTDDVTLMDKLKNLVEINGICMVQNMYSIIQDCVNKIFWNGDLEMMFSKMMPIIEFIKSNVSIKVKLERVYGGRIPSDDNILGLLRFLEKVFSALKKEVVDYRNMDTNIRQTILVDYVPLLTDIKDTNNWSNELFTFQSLIKTGGASISCSTIYNKFKDLLEFYRSTSFRVYRQDRFIRSALKNNIVKHISDMVKSRDDKEDSVLKSGGIIYALANILDISKEKSVNPWGIITDSRDLMNALIPICDVESFGKLFTSVSIRREPFDAISSYENLLGSNMKRFADFALNISTASGAPMDSILGFDLKMPQALNIYCYYNNKIDALFENNECLIKKNK